MMMRDPHPGDGRLFVYWMRRRHREGVKGVILVFVHRFRPLEKTAFDG